MRLKYIYSYDARSEECNAIIAKHFPHLLVEEKPELILVCGGDGAMLHAIQEHKESGVPFLGKAQGTLNFLMNEIDNWKKTIDDLLHDRIPLHQEKVNTIMASYRTPHTPPKLIGEAINEVVIGDSIMGFHHFVINSAQHGFNQFSLKGSGLSISTALGSTGFNFNNHGMILPLNGSLWSLTGIVADKNFNNILPEQELKIKVTSERERPKIFLDGIPQPFAFELERELLLEPGREVTLSFLNATSFATKRTRLANPLLK